MKDYSFAEAIEEATPRLQAAFTHMADQMQECVRDLADWWEPRREAFLEQRDAIDEHTRKLGDAFEELWRSIHAA